MQADQRIAIELPLRISIWEDEAGRTQIAFPQMKELAARYGLGDLPIIAKMQQLLETCPATTGARARRPKPRPMLQPRAALAIPFHLRHWQFALRIPPVKTANISPCRCCSASEKRALRKAPMQ